MLAALGRAIERTIGGGAIDVDVPGYGTSVHPMVLPCAAPSSLDADGMLASVRRALDSLTVRHLVRGVPDDPRSQPVSSVLFAGGPTAVTRAHLGHVLELRAYRDGDVAGPGLVVRRPQLRALHRSRNSPSSSRSR